MSVDRRPLTLLHTADIHLGLDYDPLRARRAFEAVVSLALEHAVDAVVIAGDLFDSNRVDAREVAFAAGQLRRLHAPCVLLPGNHDQYDECSVYRRVHLPSLCDRVLLLHEPEGNVVRLPELGLTVWGRPVVDHSPDFRPLAGAPDRGAGWHVAVAHGFYVPPGQSTCRSSPVRHDEVAALGWDYLALGHVHRFADVSAGHTVACYPGAPFTYDSGPGAAGTAALVRLDPASGVAVMPLEVRAP